MNRGLQKYTMLIVIAIVFIMILNIPISFAGSPTPPYNYCYSSNVLKSCSLITQVVAGDIIIVGTHVICSGSSTPNQFQLSDSLGNSFSTVPNTGVNHQSYIDFTNIGVIWYATAISSGVDNITSLINPNSGCGSGDPSISLIDVFDIHGGTVASISGCSGVGNAVPPTIYYCSSPQILSSFSFGIGDSFTSGSGTITGFTPASGFLNAGYNFSQLWAVGSQYSQTATGSSSLDLTLDISSSSDVAWGYSGLTMSGIWIPPSNRFVITTTLTEVGMLVPCFAGGSGCGSNGGYSWLLGMLFLLIPPSILSSMFAATDEGKRIVSNYAHIESNGLIFTMLLGLLIGSILGVMPTINALPLWTPFVFGVIFVIYLWKGRD